MPKNSPSYLDGVPSFDAADRLAIIRATRAREEPPEHVARKLLEIKLAIYGARPADFDWHDPRRSHFEKLPDVLREAIIERYRAGEAAKEAARNLETSIYSVKVIYRECEAAEVPIDPPRCRDVISISEILDRRRAA